MRCLFHQSATAEEIFHQSSGVSCSNTENHLKSNATLCPKRKTKAWTRDVRFLMADNWNWPNYPSALRLLVTRCIDLAYCVSRDDLSWKIVCNSCHHIAAGSRGIHDGVLLFPWCLQRERPSALNHLLSCCTSIYKNLSKKMLFSSTFRLFKSVSQYDIHRYYFFWKQRTNVISNCTVQKLWSHDHSNTGLISCHNWRDDFVP